jgi:hypothetical protein
MSQSTVIKRKCEQCSAIAEDENDSIPSGWIHIDGYIGVNKNPTVSAKGEFDFCCIWCARDFIDKIGAPEGAAQAEPPIPTARVPSFDELPDDMPL